MIMTDIMSDPGSWMEGGMLILTLIEIAGVVVLAVLYNTWSKY